MTLKMTTTQVVETSVTVTNSSFQNYTHPDDHTRQTNINFVNLQRILLAGLGQGSRKHSTGWENHKTLNNKDVCLLTDKYTCVKSVTLYNRMQGGQIQNENWSPLFSSILLSCHTLQQCHLPVHNQILIHGLGKGM